MLRIVEQAYRTDTGRQRNANEDSYFARSPLFAVADGMGGAQAGEVASRLAAESFEPVERGEESPEAYLRAIARTANARIHRLAQDRRLALGNGDDADRCAGRGRRGELRSRGRQPRLPVSRRRAEAADVRPLAGRGASPPGPPHRRAGRGPSAALDHHQGAGARARGRGGHDDLPSTAGRRLPAVLRRADDDAPRGPDRGGTGRLAPSLDDAVSSASSARPTRRAAETTSRWSPSGSRRPRWRPRSRGRRDPGRSGRRGGRPDRRARWPRAGGAEATRPARPLGGAASHPADVPAAGRRRARHLAGAGRDRGHRGLAGVRGVGRPPRSTSSAPTPAGAWRSTAAFPTTCRSTSSSTRRSTPPRSRSARSRAIVATAPINHTLRFHADAVSPGQGPPGGRRAHRRPRRRRSGAPGGGAPRRPGRQGLEGSGHAAARKQRRKSPRRAAAARADGGGSGGQGAGG